MQPLGLNEIREKYLSFFESKGHLRVPSAPLVPQGDSSLLLINSGMAPLKPYFSGEATPPSLRVTSCQKCIRTPDIERVGKTSRHGTFFEMLGNFSFGDYFKREAIAWTWEFFTEVMDIDPSLLHCSVYLDDDEAWDIWTREIGVDETHMVRLGKEDNFWEIGMGPCGPCSEIYYDRGPENGCGKPDCKVGCDCDRYVEIGNNVFTQFYNDGQGNYTPLAQKNIDFGMGLERLACVVQGVSNLFEVDTIQNIMAHISKIAGVKYGENEKNDVSLRVITDHIRSTTMLISDGVLPSNEGRGYVLRRLLRRAARHGRLLGINKPFLHEVCGTVIGESQSAYPELAARAETIRRVVANEEERFASTIDAGMRMLQERVQEIRTKAEALLPGADAFRLYDTFGFPIDLTRELLEELGLTIDMDGFARLMDEQRAKARAARAAMGDLGWTGLDIDLPDTPTLFTGYETLHEKDAKILTIVVEGEQSAGADQGTTASVILDKTPLYAESGGQVADHGTFSQNGTTVMELDSVTKIGDGIFLHTGRVVAGHISAGDSVDVSVDPTYRQAIMRAHSATHLLQKALRDTLGGHVQQAGSLVEPDRLRFDFTHFAAMTSAELDVVATRVNEAILAGYPVHMEEMPIDEARKKGAMALFGEKYGQTVRVVQMGDYSTELCGGTHLDNTAKAGSFLILSESSVASGVRRIEAVVGHELLRELQRGRLILNTISGLFKAHGPELIERAEQNFKQLRELRREIEQMQIHALKGETESLLADAVNIAGLHVVTARKDVPADALRHAADLMKDKDPAIVAVLCAQSDGKLTFAAVCGKEAVAKGVKAGDLIREAAAITGGSGGGRPDSAMGGGRDPSKIDEAFKAVLRLVTEKAE